MRRLAVAIAFVVLIASPALARNAATPEAGIASMYASKFVGRHTASGEILDRNRFTAAHRNLPFGTKLMVTNQRNGRSILVTVNDRGPHRKGRIIDLSPAAARELHMESSGLVPVLIQLAYNR
jgi:rare lipoprotein A